MASDNKQNELALLLSAYLDGELSPNQTQKLEKRLAADPAARQLLQELQQVSTSIQDLPRERIPVDLIDPVQRSLERDLLIGQAGQDLHDPAGQRHLALRKFIAAAAMIALTAGVVFIAYRVLYKAPTNSRNNGEPIVAIAPPATMPEIATRRTLASTENAASKADSFTTDLDLTPPTDAPEYVTLRFQLTSAEPVADARIVEFLLAENDIKHVLRADTDKKSYSYAFVCSPDILRDLYRNLDARDQSQRDMVVSITDPLTQEEVSIADITESQLVALATDSRPYIPQLLVRSSRNAQESAPSAEQYAYAPIGSGFGGAAPRSRRAAPSMPDDSVGHAPLAAAPNFAAPAQQTESVEPQTITPLTVAEAEPPMMDLQPLAQIEPATAPPCPEEMLTNSNSDPCQDSADLAVASATLPPMPNTASDDNINQWVAVVLDIMPTAIISPMTANINFDAAPSADQPPVSPIWLMQLRARLTPKAPHAETIEQE